MSTLLPEIRRPIIEKNGDMWTYITANTILISASQTDKDYMLRSQQEWDNNNV